MIEAFLAAASSERRPEIDLRVAVVVAHPDDETLGCGALMRRCRDLRILHVTDGAPRAGGDAAERGFGDAACYAAARHRELAAALALAGIEADRASCLDVPDQGAAHDLAGIARRLAETLAWAEIVLTHAFEGGHPDHDSTAFAVRAAARLAGQQGVVEMPFYRAADTPDGWLRQSFGPAGDAAILRLTEGERRLKSAMLAAHASQAETLAPFGAADEAFRAARPTDFSQAPNDGQVLYDRYGWGVASAEFGRLAASAAAELGFDDPWL